MKSKPKSFAIITLFPDLVEPYVNSSILGRAQQKKLIAVKTVDPRAFTNDKHNTADDRPYGGGPGMVLKAEPILKAVDSLGKPKGRRGIFIMSPRGKQFDDAEARKLAKSSDELVFICGRYEGIDARVKKILKAKDMSVGPYVLTGGELPALAIVDAVARHIPGVLGDAQSLEHMRTAPEDTYTRPDTIVYNEKKYVVPAVLISGHHARVESWRSKTSSKKKPPVN